MSLKDKKGTIRLNFEFPRQEYPYLKMVCALKGVSFKEFATQLLINAIEEYEDYLLVERAEKRLGEIKDDENVPFEEARKLAGWDDDEKVHDCI